MVCLTISLASVLYAKSWGQMRVHKDAYHLIGMTVVGHIAAFRGSN